MAPLHEKEPGSPSNSEKRGGMFHRAPLVKTGGAVQAKLYPDSARRACHRFAN